MAGVQRSPTFLVGTERQRGILDDFQRRDQVFSEAYQKNKPLCFNARGYQKTHPLKAQSNHKDADATLASPLVVGVADGVSQLEDFGVDASEFPIELLRTCEDIAMSQLIPGDVVPPQDAYRGPVSLLREAYEATESLGSTTILLSILDNTTTIHGKLHPMIGVLSIGDCELLMLRRSKDNKQTLQAVFHTEMQRIEGNVQTPLQLARVDAQIDIDFEESLAIEVIERGSAVHCISAFEGDILVMGTDGVFDNLFLDEIVEICNAALRPTLPLSPQAPGLPPLASDHKPLQPGTFHSTPPGTLAQVARRIVEEAHAKCGFACTGFYDTPVGRGGKADDTSVVVAEVVEWTRRHSEAWGGPRTRESWGSFLGCGGLGLNSCNAAPAPCKKCGVERENSDFEEDMRRPSTLQVAGTRRATSTMQPVRGHHLETADDEEKCSIS